jgi:predicted nucleotidyltransferase
MEDLDNPAIVRMVERARNDVEILAVILFGSQARSDAHPASDHDICLVLTGDGDDAAASRKRLEYLAAGDLDVVVFQQLPLPIRHRVLKEGRLLFAHDEDALYAAAIRTARAFEGFRHIHRAYLEEVARG